MKQKLYIVTEVVISEGSEYVPQVCGIYQTYQTAKDNAVVFLYGLAAMQDISEKNVDTTSLRLANDMGTVGYQMGISEVELGLAPVFKVR